ncbi:hypothetical protein GOV12_02655 [Candidatus Pacearchaeota archaeon]|nr:hypothetical protein [Candidatus Pacearchaeota archaeon]
MKEYVVNLCKRAYEMISPEYARSRRMVRFESLVESGDLAGMCASEVHEMFGIKKWSKEF